MADVQNISIDGTSYSCRDNSKAPKSEAIKNITRSGTTFTATRCDNTTFTFTQQDNNTTTGTTYTAGNVPANTTFGTNGSIKNAYDGLNSSKAPKSEAIKSISRSGTTFTATRCDDTTFTFTQQDNNTTTGTTYTAGNVPANTTFGTNGSIKNAYDGLNSNKAPKNEAIKSITRSGTTFTATRCDDTTFTFTQQDTNTTYGVVSKTTNGLCPQLPNETTTTKYLRQDGTWQIPPDNNTTTGTTYTAGNVPANTTFGTNGSIKNAYDGLNSSKAPKSEAIKSITRSGTTFTATRCDDTTFTFTQQDNNTWRPVQNNLTSQSTSDCLSAKQGALLASADVSPDYGSSALSSGNISPTSTGYTWTSTNHNSVAFISYWRQTAGYTLTIQVNGITVFQVPANTAGFGTATIPLLKGQVLKILTDTTSASWTCNIRAFNCNLY